MNVPHILKEGHYAREKKVLNLLFKRITFLAYIHAAKSFLWKLYIRKV